MLTLGWKEVSYVKVELEGSVLCQSWAKRNGPMSKLGWKEVSYDIVGLEENVL